MAVSSAARFPIIAQPYPPYLFSPEPQMKDHNPFAFETKHKMYPRVKVREQEQHGDLHPQDDSNSLLLSKDIESISVNDRRSPVNVNDNESLPSLAKIPTTCAPKLAMPLNSASKGTEKKNKYVGINGIMNDGAILGFRPRAVLSSPENDGMIGSINKLTTRKFSTSEKQSVQKKSPARANKLIPCRVKRESTLRMRIGLREASDEK